MSTFLRGRTRRRKPKGNPRRKNRIKEFFQIIGFIIVIVIFAIAGSVEYDPTGYIKGKKIFKEPKVETIIKVKKVIKYKTKWKVKKIYINRHKHNVTAQVEYAKKKFGNDSVALAVFNAESAFETEVTPTNSDGSIDSGVAQINSCHCRKDGVARKMLGSNCLEQLKNYKKNIDVAYRLSKGGKDWSPWVAYQNGNYLRYLNSFN